MLVNLLISNGYLLTCLLDRLLNPEDSIVPYSREMSKDLLELLVTMTEQNTFDSPRNSYIKTNLVASVLERTGWSFLVSET